MKLKKLYFSHIFMLYNSTTIFDVYFEYRIILRQETDWSTIFKLILYTKEKNQEQLKGHFCLHTPLKVTFIKPSQLNIYCTPWTRFLAGLQHYLHNYCHCYDKSHSQLTDNGQEVWTVKLETLKKMRLVVLIGKHFLCTLTEKWEMSIKTCHVYFGHHALNATNFENTSVC